MKKRFFFVLFTIFISAFLFCKSSPAKKTKPVNSTSTTRKTASPSNSKKRVQQKKGAPRHGIPRRALHPHSRALSAGLGRALLEND